MVRLVLGYDQYCVLFHSESLTTCSLTIGSALVSRIWTAEAVTQPTSYSLNNIRLYGINEWNSSKCSLKITKAATPFPSLSIHGSMRRRYCGNCTSYLRHEFVSMGDGELTPAYFMLELPLVFSAFNSHL